MAPSLLLTLPRTHTHTHTPHHTTPHHTTPHHTHIHQLLQQVLKPPVISVKHKWNLFTSLFSKSLKNPSNLSLFCSWLKDWWTMVVNGNEHFSIVTAEPRKYALAESGVSPYEKDMLLLVWYFQDDPDRSVLIHQDSYHQKRALNLNVPLMNIILNCSLALKASKVFSVAKTCTGKLFNVHWQRFLVFLGLGLSSVPQFSNNKKCFKKINTKTPPPDTERKMKVWKTFKRHFGCLNIFRTFNLCPVPGTIRLLY